MKILAVLILSGLLIVSCGKTYRCPNETLSLAFVSYADQEIDSIWLKKFTAGSGFGQKIDSVLLKTSEIHADRQGDTVTFLIVDAQKRLNENYDWQIVNPFDQSLVSVSEMKFEDREGKSPSLFGLDPAGCFSPLISFRRNNIVVVPQKINGNSYLLIHK